MTRFLVACAALVAVVGPARADPQPLWEIDTATDKLRPREVRWVGFSPDDKVLVARLEYMPEGKRDPSGFLGTKERLLAWDTKSRKERFDLAIDSADRFYTGLVPHAMTAEGSLLVPAKGPNEVRLADGKTKSLDSQVFFKRVVAVWINPETRSAVWLSSVDLDGYYLDAGTLPAFDAEPKRPPQKLPRLQLPTVKDAYTIRSVAVSSDTKLVAVASEDYESRKIPSPHALGLYSLAVGETAKLTEVAVVPGGHLGPISATQFSADGKTLATGSRDSSVALWDVAKAGKDWKPVATIPTGQLTVGCLAFSPDGRTLAAGTYDRKGRSNLFLIDVRGGKLVSSRVTGEAITALAYSADGKLLVTGHGEGKVRVWEAAAVRGD